MNKDHASVREYYKEPGATTDLAEFADFTNWLSADPRVLFQVTQGIILHDMWIERYGISLQESQRLTCNTPFMKDILAKALELDVMSLAIPRSPEKRVLGCCRDFATLFCAFLRSKNIPARSRCGFALYLAQEGFYEDHWICEYWRDDRWVMVDPQIDPFQQSTFQDWAKKQTTIGDTYKDILMNLDPLEIRGGTDFLLAGEAWQMCRSEKVDPLKFGVSADPSVFDLDSLNGLWFVRGNLLRDFAALNKVEMEPFLDRIERGTGWDEWRFISAKDENLSKFDWQLLDHIAELSLSPDQHHDEIHDLYVKETDLQVPESMLQN